jgi:hypothetical protein
MIIKSPLRPLPIKIGINYGGTMREIVAKIENEDGSSGKTNTVTRI